MNARRLAAPLAAALCALLFVAPTAGAWAPAASATVHPGVQTFTDGAQCTANFIFQDASNVYIGQAAHCSGTGGNTETNGCTSQSLPDGTPVDVTGASHPGVMVYNSWNAMQRVGEKNADICQYNDIALIRLDPTDVAKTNPSIPFWGGPTGVNTTGTQSGDEVESYGNSELRGGVSALSPKEGKSLGDGANGWTRDVYTVTPGIPGDSGSAFIDAAGKALGILSTVQIAPLAGSNGVGDVAKEVAYMQSHGGPAASVVNGTEAFTGPLSPV
ncbi:MAG TPA: trypsin-like serine protease [Solirubrobacteraceae bacterium]